MTESAADPTASPARLPPRAGAARAPVSVTIIARNEAHRIGRCLDSVRWADEIVVVVDDQTSDGTADVARRYTDRVHLRPFRTFAEQRQWADAQATGEWILSIDCDEVVPPPLAAEIEAELAAPRFDAYQVPHLDYMFGKWIRWGGQFPQYHNRLYRRGTAEWTSLIHEKVDVAPGRLGRLAHPILHYSHLRVADFIDKLARYTTPDARQMFERGERASWARLLVEPPLYFGYKYVVQQGFRDGMHGLALSLLHGTYRFVRNVKLWDLQQAARRRADPMDRPPPIEGPRR